MGRPRKNPDSPPRKRTGKIGSGRNQPPTTIQLSNSGLEKFVDRLERLETERRDAAAAIAEVLVEAEQVGFNKKALRAIVKRRLETPEQEAARLATEEAFDDMLSKLGMLRDTPLGEAAQMAFRSAGNGGGEFPAA